jgi:cathepsin L
MGYEYSFETFMTDFNKAYATEEIETRRANFEANLLKIKEHNQQKLSWQMGVNAFADMSATEFKATKLGYSKAMARTTAAPVCDRLPKVKLPTDLDWRDKNVVTPVKNQEACGSCWAFSTAETIESHLAIRTGTLDVLSPQEFVDCVPNPDHCGGTGGCEGATQWLGFAYAMKNGVATEASYPYQGRDETCDKSKMNIVGNITGYCRLPHVSSNFSAAEQYSELMQAVTQQGPIAISAAAEPWQLYERGVFSSKHCGTDVDHAIQLVGYGTAKEIIGGSADYWLVRNSWGPGWGEKGYIRIKRYGATGDEPCAEDTTPGDGTACKGSPSKIEVCGECGIMSDSSYPLGGSIRPAF